MFEQVKQEREAALGRYAHEKRTKHKVLAKKNFRGQPKLNSQIQLLVQKIEASRKT